MNEQANWCLKFQSCQRFNFLAHTPIMDTHQQRDNDLLMKPGRLPPNKIMDEYTVTSSICGSDDTNSSGGNQESQSEEAIAKRLREKIRMQAEDLLHRVDSIRDHNSNGFTATAMASPIQRPTATPTTTTTTIVSPSLESSTATTATSSSLTKRLQALAIQNRVNRQENNAQRLQSIQHEQLHNHHQDHLRSSSLLRFSDLQPSLPQVLLDGIYRMGFDRPSAIQAASLPIILQGQNLIGQAQSGSGKTAAFCIGMLAAIDITQACPQAICVVPTRELAIQIVEQTIAPLSQCMDQSLFSTQLAISQTSLLPSQKHVTAQIVVGTPGKVVDWLKRKLIHGKTVSVLVLDEADEMVETHRVYSLLLRKHLPSPNLQTLLFSATFNDSTMEFADKFVVASNHHRPCERILIDSEDLVLTVIKQVWIDTRNISKLEFLADIYSILTIAQSIVFVNTKADANKVYATLTDSGYTCSVIHSAIEDRDTVMQQFRSGSSNVLISTNVLARGVDVDAVCLVINYDVRTYRAKPCTCTVLLRLVSLSVCV
jgi:ATP-dependent RNA helicase DDX19/DBP5